MATSDIRKDFIVENVTLDQSVVISSGGTTSPYNIPQKTGYAVAGVTPFVQGSGWGNISAICSTNNTIYFRNNATYNITATLTIKLFYTKQ